jgi:hypothetical protein
MKKIELLSKELIFLLFYTFCFSCNLEADKNKGFHKKVSMICLKDNDTIYVKVINGSDSAIFIPQQYTPNFSDNDDTLHFETVDKPKYSISYYYKYKSIFPFEFYTARRINGYKPDTIERYKKQYIFFNQFRVGPMISIKPGSSYIEKLEFNVPKYVNVLQAIYYPKPFSSKNRLNRFDYSYGDFSRFDSISGFHVNTPILIRYR